ncbi:glutamine synthetase III, partial [Baffinella frigidus]
VCDAIETKCPVTVWPFASYKELLFLDSNQDAFGHTTKSLGNYTRSIAAAPGQPGFGGESLAVAELTPTLEIQKLGYGTKRFIGAVADKYLAKYGESSKIFEDASWTKTKADVVAKALLDWGRDTGARVFTHWFQPLGANGVRHGGTGQVHNHMFTFGKDGKPKWEFSGGELLKGETDGSSYPNGGLRATHTAGAYTALDPTSAIFMMDDTIFIPTCFVSWNGDALDEKTPLLRAEEAMSRECSRLLKTMGHTTAGCKQMIGLEQEFFLVPREAWATRSDLQLTGRTILGAFPARGQEMCDHYMGPLNQHALACIKEIQAEAFKLGIPLRTRHREVAPGQYEMAPYFGHAPEQIDQNTLVMQLCEEVAGRYGLTCLNQEKPFQGINGSGKHNNWSISTKEGVNLLNANQVTKATGNKDVFPVIMTAIVAAVDKHGDLMRCAIASPGNDFRLGAMEAPPAIISTYLGTAVTEFLDAYRKGSDATYSPAAHTVKTGCASVDDFEVPIEDRNRTSPFPYGGHRFEFRAVGSAQNVSMVNTVLATICAEQFKEFADQIEAGKKPQDVAAASLNEHWKVIFNGNGYDKAWPVEADKRGIWRIDSGVDAMDVLVSPKNLELFANFDVLSNTETQARRDIMLQHYAGIVEIEAGCMIDMVVRQIIPALRVGGIDTKALADSANAVKTGLHALEQESDDLSKAKLARVLRLETMEKCRAISDAIEEGCPQNVWPLATYKDLLFLDSNQDAFGVSTTSAVGAYTRQHQGVWKAGMPVHHAKKFGVGHSLVSHLRSKMQSVQDPASPIA